MIGLTVEEASGPPVEVWDCNWQTVEVFETLGTQWRTGMHGPTGLDYSAITTVLRLKKVARKDWAALFDDLRIMEDAALATMLKDVKRNG